MQSLSPRGFVALSVHLRRPALLSLFAISLMVMGMADARAQDVTTSGIAPKLVSAPSTSVEGRCQP